jgi:ethanolamine ammonia-lyase large subunit
MQGLYSEISLGIQFGTGIPQIGFKPTRAALDLVDKFMKKVMEAINTNVFSYPTQQKTHLRPTPPGMRAKRTSYAKLPLAYQTDRHAE